MSGKRYTDEFKVEAVRQVTERVHSVADVAERLSVTPLERVKAKNATAFLEVLS